jgi:arsenite methyltransferase
LAVSDIVLGAALPSGVRESVEAYVGCIAGAQLKEEYLQLIRDAGFKRIEVVRENRYTGSSGCLPEGVDPKALTQVMSLGVRAYKPMANGQ